MTQGDVDTLLEFIRADFNIIARKTELWSLETCEEHLYDIEQFLRNDYLTQINVILKDNFNQTLRAIKYLVEPQTYNGTNERPGSIDWDSLGGTNITIVVSYSNLFKNIDYYKRINFKNSLKGSWGETNEDVTFYNLNRNISKNYLGSSSSIKRVDYNNGSE